MPVTNIISAGGATCTRAWEIEAARDGRLSGDALLGVAQHVRQCDECRAHSKDLDGLAAALRALPETATDALTVRRLRHQVLAQVDAELSGRSPKLTPSRTYFGVAAALAGAVLAIGGWHYMHPTSISDPRSLALLPSARALAAENTTIDTVDEGGAQWSQRTEGEFERIDLSEGTLRLHVQKTPAGKRVVVHVPDGEIEDIGTTFHVVVIHGRTQRVGVDEGRVTLRLGNATPITLRSGQSWERAEDGTSLPVATLGPPRLGPPPLLAVASTKTPLVPSPFAFSKAHAQIGPDGSGGFQGQPPHAADEDATYLHALRLLREGQDLQAKAVARDYLRKFPDGFRREEMGRIAR